MEVMALKLDALEHRQDLDQLVDLYAQFQRYVELLIPIVRGETPPPELEATHTRLQLALRDEEGRFLEWRDGTQLLNPHIYGLVDDAHDVVRDAASFARTVAAATAKFEHLIRQSERSLRQLHDKISLVEGETQAQEVTALETKSELQARLTKADVAAELGLKWGRRVYEFSSWAVAIAKNLNL
jgi:hypothetical protein